MATSTAVAAGKYKCDKCDRSFEKPQQLSMHKVRMHTRAGKRGWQLAISNSSRRKARAKLVNNGQSVFDEERRRKLSEGMRKSWARRKGKKSSAPMSREEALAARRLYYRKLAAENRAKGLNAHGDPLKSKNGGRPSFLDAGADKRAAQAARARMYYHRAKERKAKAATADSTGVVFCPRCGCNVEAVRLAIQFANQR